VVVDDPLVSRRHARLLANDTTVLIEDLRSDNGVFVNEERIRRSVRLEDGEPHPGRTPGARLLGASLEFDQKMWSGTCRPRP